MIASPPETRIERVPCLLIGLLGAAGKLPAASAEVDALSQRPGRRSPTVDEAAAYTWVIAWRGPVGADGFRTVGGIIAYRDVFDFHTATDVREIAYLKGGDGTCITLIRWLRGATEPGRRLVGFIDAKNERLYRALTAMGCTPTRILFEDLE